jgi:hypothetical protein
VNGTDSLRCFACDHSYRYLGEGHHPGRCPRCDSTCVTPAGELTVLTSVDVPSVDRPGATVLAIDERYRHFLYHFERVGEAAELAGLQVDGHVVRPDDGPRSIPVPAAVRSELTASTGTLPPG